MKFKDYLKEINTLAEDYPEALECEVYIHETFDCYYEAEEFPSYRHSIDENRVFLN